jgi:branched-chain amino acid transport system substrate-binding protein
MNVVARTIAALVASCILAAVSGAALAAPSGKPIRIGSTLALTGPLAATGQVHKIVGEIYVEQLNAKNGLLGRPVEWIVRDDQSKPDLARTLYEQLITVDKVDLVIGPYATGAILSAMGVAQRYDKLLIHHTFGIPNLAKYERQFPTWSLGPEPQNTFPNTVLDALAASPKPPKTIAVVTSKFPSVHFLSLGAREVAKKRGVKEVLFLEWEFGNRDYGPIAARIKEANPDFLWVGAIGLEGNQLIEAMKKLDYMPKEHFYLYPAPGRWSNRRTRTTRSPARFSRSTRRSPVTRRPRRSSRCSTSARRKPDCRIPRSIHKPLRRIRPGRCSRRRSPRRRASTTRCLPRG